MEASMGTDEIFILVQEMRECDTLNKQPEIMFLVIVRIVIYNLLN